MRLVLCCFNNILGMNGHLGFVADRPLLIYGDNIAGKSNIINILRYCLIPKLKEKKVYAEEKRLRKDEILLKTNSAGSAEIYFEQGNKIYRLYYSFSKKGKKVGQLQRIYEHEAVKIPSEDGERTQILGNLQWKDLSASTSKSLKEKLVEIGIYPEVLDILISASNVRNFSEAINGSVVKVPDIVAAKISSLHDNAGKYLENLKKLQGVLVLEKDEYEKRIRDLKSRFKDISKNLPGIKVDEIFVSGLTATNLNNIRKNLIKELDLMPEKTTEMTKTLTSLSSGRYDLWTNAIDKFVAILPRKEELKSLLTEENRLCGLEESTGKWKTVFEQLPPDSNLESIVTFILPDYEKFDFSVFSNPDRIKSLFQLTNKAKECVNKANGICEKYKTVPKFAQINEMIKSYDALFKALRTPSKATGDPALISRISGKTRVSIPLEVALANVEYLRGVEPTPLVHRPAGLDETKFEEKVKRVQEEINTCRMELKGARASLSEASRLLKQTKQIRGSLDGEIRLLEERKKKVSEDLSKLVDEWKNAYHHVCEVFKLESESIDLSCPDSVDTSCQTISNKYMAAQEIFESNLAEQLKNFPEFLTKYKGKKPMDIVQDVTKEFQEKIQTMTALQNEYKKVNDWILSNSDQIKALENKNRTGDIVKVGSAIALELLSRAHKKADVNKIIDELADKIEINVRDVYGKIFPEDETFTFEHSEKGQFLCSINNEPITHPSGSQRVAISIGIMLSLGETFGLPILLDEAFDRIDVNRLRFFAEYITGIAGSPRTPQICLAGFTTYNIEKSPEVLHFVGSWKIYSVKRTHVLEKNIQLLTELPASQSN